MDIEGQLYQNQSLSGIYLPILLQYTSCEYFKDTFIDHLVNGRHGNDKYDNDYDNDIMEPD
jgi:hypothetical protein